MDINIIQRDITRYGKPKNTKLSEKKHSQKERRVQIYTGSKLWHQINDYAKKEGITRSRIIRTLLEHFFDEMERKNK